MCRGVGGRAAEGSGEGSKARPIFGSAENAKIVSSYPLGGSRPGIFHCKQNPQEDKKIQSTKNRKIEFSLSLNLQ